MAAALGLAAASWAHDGAAEDAPAATPTAEALDQHEQVFLDRSGRARSFVPTYEEWFGSRREPKYGRAVVESIGVVAAGTAYYWLDPLANKEDWDDPPLTDKLWFEAVRFDTNLNTTNNLLHPGAGALIYGLGRDNGLSVPVAFGYSLASSVLWEFALEWREQVSVNDLVFTAVGGVPIGEFFHHLGGYVNSAPYGGSVPRTIARYTLGLPRAFHAWLDDEEPPPALPADALGFSSAYGHGFRVGYQAAALTNDLDAEGMLHRFALDAEIVAMPGFLHPGRFETSFAQGNFADFHLRFGWGDTGFDEGDVQSDVVLAGHYGQDFRLTERGGLEGTGAMVGIGSGWRFHSSKLLGRRDQLSVVHVVGPYAALWAASGPLTARLSADAHIDFGAVRSLAYPDFRDRYGDEGLKTVLVRQGYTYDLGWSGRLRGSVGLGPLELSGRVLYGNYESIEGLDRFQERVTRDVHGNEQVLEAGAWASVRVASLVEIGVGVSERRRWSSLGDVSYRRWDRAYQLNVGLVF